MGCLFCVVAADFTVFDLPWVYVPLVQCGVNSIYDCPGQHISDLAHRILTMANGTEGVTC